MTQNNKKNSRKDNQNLNLPPGTKVIAITGRKILIFFLIIILGIAVYQSLGKSFGANIVEKTNTDIGLNQIATNYSQKSYEEVVVKGQQLRAKKPLQNAEENGKMTQIREIDAITLPATLNIADIGFLKEDNGTKITIEEAKWYEMLADAVPGFLGTLILFFIFIFFLTRMMGGSGGPMGGAMGFIRSRARMYDPDDKDKVTFADVAGSEEEKSDLEEVVDFLKNPEKYKKLGAKIPRGILLQGPPGTGKTLLARAVAGESNVPFFSISGSEFVEMFVGVGASRVRDLFAEAREKSPSIIFIDEIDAIGKKRSPGIGGGHDEREQTLNQILTEMDGFDNDTNVIVMAATNRADVLDKALLRPGRFDRKVTINLPTLEDRKKILVVHQKNKPFAKDVNWDTIANITIGFSGAELGNLLNEAAILAGAKIY